METSQKEGKKDKSIFGGDKIIRGYKKFNRNEKFLMWILIGSMVIALCIMATISSIRTYDSDLSLQECNQLRADDVRYALHLQEDNNILAFIYAFQFPFKFLLIAIAMAWILHGVGFHIIKR